MPSGEKKGTVTHRALPRSHTQATRAAEAGRGRASRRPSLPAAATLSHCVRSCPAQVWLTPAHCSAPTYLPQSSTCTSAGGSDHPRPLKVGQQVRSPPGSLNGALGHTDPDTPAGTPCHQGGSCTRCSARASVRAQVCLGLANTERPAWRWDWLGLGTMDKQQGLTWGTGDPKNLPHHLG